MAPNELLTWVRDRIAAAERVEVLEFDVIPDGDAYLCRTMVPARSACLLGEAVIVRFEHPQQAQDAFNMAASLLPEHLKLKASRDEGGPEWLYFPAECTASDPLGQYGYIGWRVRRDLAPGEFIARARLHSEPGTVRFTDILVTAETLPVLRASGEYADIISPRALVASGE